MKRLLWLLVPLVLQACSSSVALPPGDVLSWTLPTTRTDGTALPILQIKDVIVMWGPSGGPYNVGSKIIAAPGLTTTIPRDATPGTLCYVILVEDTTVPPLVSDATNEACVVSKAKPNKATNFTAS